MKSALCAAPGLRWARWMNRGGSCQCAGSWARQGMHGASVLPGSQPALCCIILVPLVKMPLFLFPFQDLTKASAISCPTVLPVNSEWCWKGEKGSTKHKESPTILRILVSKRIKGTLQDSPFSLIRYVCFQERTHLHRMLVHKSPSILRMNTNAARFCISTQETNNKNS